MAMSGKLRIPSAEVVRLEPVLVFFTVDSSAFRNPGSARVVEEMKKIVDQPTEEYHNKNIRCIVFSSDAECEAFWETSGMRRERAVAVYDGSPRNHFSPRQLGGARRGPEWAPGVLWGVEMSPARVIKHGSTARNAALTSLAYFHRRFQEEIKNERFPWGLPPKGSRGPGSIVRINEGLMHKISTALNSGPDLAAAIASKDFAADLPEGSRISWLRITPGPLGYQSSMMQKIVNGVRAFEEACGQLIQEDASVRNTILSGVTIPDPRLAAVYVNPGVSRFSVTRPDIHWHQDRVNASEIDEMPGGMPELVHIDAAYGVNQERWAQFFNWLTDKGKLVFVVSHDWSGCYIPETAWLVDYLQGKGYDAHILRTDELDRLDVRDDGAYLDNQKIGTAWRQFPIFETSGKLADLVLAARSGHVRLVPEFAHFGNKAWFYLFRRYEDWYRQHLGEETFTLLQEILPDSHFVDGDHSFPCTVGSLRIERVGHLLALPQEARDGLVLKVCGANARAARSYGVLMGEGIKAAQWAEWVGERTANDEPFLIQERFHPGVLSMPVWNAGSRATEMFSCKLLMRPWAYGPNNEIVAVHGCAVPHQFHKVHGMVAMAVTPVELIDGEIEDEAA